MLKKGNQISLAGGQPGQGAGGQEGTRVGKVMGEFMPLTSLLPLPLQSPSRLRETKLSHRFYFVVCTEPVSVCLCVNERVGGLRDIMWGLQGDSRPGSGLSEMSEVRGQGPGLEREEDEWIGEKGW